MMAFPQVSDEVLVGVVPIAVYWLYSGMYVLLDPYLDRYRIFPKEDGDESKNIATKAEVVRGTLVEQAFQGLFFLLTFLVKRRDDVSSPPQPALPVMALQFLVAMFALDTWQYFNHRLLHVNKFLYKHIHSKHHKLIVTHPYGAQFNHPVEGFILDTVGGIVAFLVSGMTPKTALYFFTFAVVKGVEDHTGLFIPWNPLHRFFENNSVWHSIHHQLYGQKFNYATPFFGFWDRLFGTRMGYEVRKREEGDGYEIRILKKQD